MNRILLVQNSCNVNGVMVSENHFFLKNGFYCGGLRFLPDTPFSHNNQQLQEITRAYAESIGLIPIRKLKR